MEGSGSWDFLFTVDYMFGHKPSKLTCENYVLVLDSQINKLEKAVAAAHTFFVGNPEHMEMRQNLDYYQTMSGVKEADFRDLEAKPHMVKKTLTPSISLFIE